MKEIKFKIKDIFRLVNPKGKHTSKQLHDGHDIPYIAAKKTNNGVLKWCSKDNLSDDEIMKGNCIVFVQQGDGSAGYTTYQPDDFYATACVCCGYIDGKLDELNGIYLVTLLDKNHKKYNHSNGWNGERLRETEISLPVIESSDPNHIYTKDDIDWKYMEYFIKELEQENIKELEQENIKELDACLKATGLNNYELTDEDKHVLSLYDEAISKEAGIDENNCEIRIKKFKIGELFECDRGDVDIQKTDLNGRGYPVVSAGTNNQGIIGKTDLPSKIFNENTITVDMFGNAYFHEYKYKEVTHARIFTLIPKIAVINRACGIYLIGSMKHLPEHFSFNNMCTYDKIKDFDISLPVTSSGEISWDFMEKYIIAIEKLTIADVVKWKNKQLETAKNYVNK